MTSALVVGGGSIGSRHARVLAEMGCDVALVSRSLPSGASVFRDLRPALERFRPGYVVVANRTSEHRAVVEQLAEAGFDGTVLVEKPIFDRLGGLPQHRFSRSAVAYNLRFHPVLAELKRRLDGLQIIALEGYAGQWLPDWRPGRDYRQTYSAHRSEGGGVLRDLSHEIDLLLWLAGGWTRVAALGGRLGPLNIDSDDVWSLLFEIEGGGVASLHVNYLDRPGRRRLVVITAERTFAADLVEGELSDNGVVSKFAVARDDSYRAQHAAMLSGGAGEPCSLGQGLEVLATIEAVELAAQRKAFVARMEVA